MGNRSGKQEDDIVIKPFMAVSASDWRPPAIPRLAIIYLFAYMIAAEISILGNY